METITYLQGTFDTLLGLGVLLVAWKMLVCPDLFRAIVLFIAFGLLLALIWVRLGAPDVALAEAAIGTGLTGALLLSALAKLPAAVKRENGPAAQEQDDEMRGYRRWLTVALLLAVAAGLGWVIISLPPETIGLRAQVAANLQISGVSNPVTAVLLNFRGYDTLLEMVVLLLVLLGVWSLQDTTRHHKAPPGPLLWIH